MHINLLNFILQSFELFLKNSFQKYGLPERSTIFSDFKSHRQNIYKHFKDSKFFDLRTIKTLMSLYNINNFYHVNVNNSR